MDNMGVPANTVKLVGGRLCLDFANTVGWHASDHPSERLRSYADLVAWSQQAGIVTDHEAQRLMEEAVHRPEAAAAVLDQAITLREGIYRIFSAVAGGRQLAADDLALLNAALTEALGHLRVVPSADGFKWAWASEQGALDRMLWPVVRSAAELLTEGELSRVRECAGDVCGWLFVDTSRNRSRRWCDMQDCGNVAKVRRFRARHRSDNTPRHTGESTA
jgi:predicted RNA-binding Zn ribbon-like protein